MGHGRCWTAGGACRLVFICFMFEKGGYFWAVSVPRGYLGRRDVVLEDRAIRVL